MKANFFFLIGIAITFFVFSSCSDDISEGDKYKLLKFVSDMKMTRSEKVYQGYDIHVPANIGTMKFACTNDSITKFYLSADGNGIGLYDREYNGVLGEIHVDENVLSITFSSDIKEKFKEVKIEVDGIFLAHAVLLFKLQE